MKNTPTTLAEWLDYIERQHPASIDMGLERVRTVATAMGLGTPAKHTIVVGGTNGKGSTVAFIEAIARAAGLEGRCVHLTAPAALQRARAHRWPGCR